jgi:hypothetical protein
MVKGFIEWEHTEEDGLILRCKPSFIDLTDGETRQHAIAARKEILLTMRSLIDGAIKRTDEKETKSKQRGVKINVE